MPRERSLVRLRTAYFAEAAASAARYGVTFDDVVRHLWQARKVRRLPLDLRSVDHVDDLVHAAACVLRCGSAWSDLIDRFEPVLVRRSAARLGETRSILVVRRTFLSLRTDETPGAGLDGYAGERSLRAWLTDRVLAESRGTRGRRATTHAEVRTQGGARLRRYRDAHPSSHWWDESNVPASFPFGCTGSDPRPVAPPGRGASDSI